MALADICSRNLSKIIYASIIYFADNIHSFFIPIVFNLFVNVKNYLKGDEILIIFQFNFCYLCIYFYSSIYLFVSFHVIKHVSLYMHGHVYVYKYLTHTTAFISTSPHNPLHILYIIATIIVLLMLLMLMMIKLLVTDIVDVSYV